MRKNIKMIIIVFIFAFYPVKLVEKVEFANPHCWFTTNPVTPLTLVKTCPNQEIYILLAEIRPSNVSKLRLFALYTCQMVIARNRSINTTKRKPNLCLSSLNFTTTIRIITKTAISIQLIILSSNLLRYIG